MITKEMKTKVIGENAFFNCMYIRFWKFIYIIMVNYSFVV